MDALKCIFSKREARDYLEKPVPEEIAQKIIDAGRLAGSAKNRQPWDFILIKSKERLRDLAAFGQSAGHLSSAAFAIVIARKDEYFQDPFDAGRAAQNMMLAAHASGLGSCPITLHRQDEAMRYLGIPADRVVQVCLSFGYPVAKQRRGTVIRKTLGETLHLEKW